MTSRTSASSTVPANPLDVLRSITRVFSMRTTSAVRWSLSFIARVSVSFSVSSSPILASGAILHGGLEGPPIPGRRSTGAGGEGTEVRVARHELVEAAHGRHAAAAEEHEPIALANGAQPVRDDDEGLGAAKGVDGGDQ